MKKFIVVILAIFFVINATCLAEVDFNPDAYTADELAEIYSIVSEKVFDCVKVPAGLYVVGKDLPAGTYTVLANKEVPGNTSDDFAHAAVFASMEDYNKNSSLFNDDSLHVMACNTLWSGMSGEWTDGMVLLVKFGKIGLSKVDNNIFNAFWN